MENSSHGTATLGQFAEVSAALTKALPKAIDGIDPKKLIAVLNKSGEKLETGLARLFNNMITDAGSLKLLEFIYNTIIPGTNEPFVIKDHLVVNTGEDAEVKISSVEDSVKKLFFEKIEAPLDPTQLFCYKLLENSVSKPIIAKLGEKLKVETTFAQIFYLLKIQRNGEGGILLTNSFGNIFFVRDAKGAFHTVFVRWLDGGWRVSAYSVEYPIRWDASDQVLSSN